MAWVYQGVVFLGAYFFLMTAALAAEPGVSPELVEIPVSQLFVPRIGYDDNDQVEALIQGELPNPCFSVAVPTAEAKPAGGYRIRQYAWLSHTGNCRSGDLIDDPVNFTSVVTLGLLKAGAYQLEFDKQWVGLAQSPLRIDMAASDDIDNFNYATVSSVELLEAYVEGQEARVMVRGVLPSCGVKLVSPMPIERVDDVFVVLPKLEKRPPQECPTIEKTFRVRLNLGTLKAGSYGLHIRSRGGRAVQSAINVLRPPSPHNLRGWAIETSNDIQR